jgi:HK97 family phage prohead protease
LPGEGATLMGDLASLKAAILENESFAPREAVLRAPLTKTPTDGSGRFIALASTPDVDRDNEAFAPGAWSQSVSEWKARGDYPPILWHHDVRDPSNIIGKVVAMEETTEGLMIEGQLDLTNPKAVNVYERMLSGALNTLSVGYLGYSPKKVGGAMVFQRADVLEVSMTPVPSNPRARVLEVKTTSASKEVARIFEAAAQAEALKDGMNVVGDGNQIGPDDIDPRTMSVRRPPKIKPRREPEKITVPVYDVERDKTIRDRDGETFHDVPVVLPRSDR